MNFALKFENDQVENWSPLTFGLRFTQLLRKHKAVSHKPSLRASIAIPKFLSARYFRCHILTAHDYIAAAVLNTVPEDQIIAKEIAQQILFPRAKNKPAKTQHKKEESIEEESVEEISDPLADIMQDLEDLNIDFDTLNELSELDSMLSSERSQEDVFELFERLYSSAISAERSLAELMNECGGPAELQAWGAHDRNTVENYLGEILSSEIGNLTPSKITHAMDAGFSEMLKRDVSEPWELAAVLACEGNSADLSAHLSDILDNTSKRTQGKTLQFLALQQEKLGESYPQFFQQVLSQTQQMSAYSELLSGYQSWIEPPDKLLEQAAKENIQQALTAAKWIHQQFNHDLSPVLFHYWADNLDSPPTLRMLVDTPVHCKRWNQLAKKAYPETVKQLHQSLANSTLNSAIDPAMNEAVKLAQDCINTQLPIAKKISGNYATEILCQVTNKAHFLPLLDELLAHKIIPSDIKKIIDTACQLGVNPNDIYDRLGDAIKQLREMVLSNSTEVARYKLLADKINDLDGKLMQQLVKQALSDHNLAAMGCCLAIHLGDASRFCKNNDFTIKSLGYKGIGGGMNLLKQWFLHRQDLNNKLRSQIKAYAKAALEELVFNWLSKGSGSSDGGLIPQNQVRPYLARDDLDLLDIESTLDCIISQGKDLAHINPEDLYVYDTNKGRAALAVLIDISGSMDGEDLAICAIAVVMLLGKVRSEEIALAMFESDTHIIKNFSDLSDLDQVMDQLLDLEARGGTCSKAAFKWANKEFERITEAEFKLLFVLSDFCFFEEPRELQPHIDAISEKGVTFLAASHSSPCKSMLNFLLNNSKGQNIKLTTMNKLPAILIETLEQIGENAFS